MPSHQSKLMPLSKGGVPWGPTWNPGPGEAELGRPNPKNPGLGEKVLGSGSGARPRGPLSPRRGLASVQEAGGSAHPGTGRGAQPGPGQRWGGGGRGGWGGGYYPEAEGSNYITNKPWAQAVN